MDQATLKERLDYDPTTGHFTWRIDRGARIKSGMRAGSLSTVHKYWVINTDYKLYMAHRLAWLWMTGEHPPADVDHINGVRADNRWSNLRQATRGENRQNMRVAKSDNKSCGVLGVTKRKDTGKFAAYVTTNHRRKALGCFGTVEEAQAAYLAAKREAHPFCTI